MLIKAIRVNEYGSPEVLKQEEIVLPEPGPDEVIVQIHAAGVNPVDTYQRSASRGYKPKLPYTPGLDGAGMIINTGANVSAFKNGDKVYIAGHSSGTYAEAAVVKENKIYHIPETLNCMEGAALFVNYFTACRALFQRGSLIEDERVLVHGASGGVGLAALQMLKWKNIDITATAGTKDGVELIKSLGIKNILNHRAPEHSTEMEACCRNGFDVILEMSSDKNLQTDLELITEGGRVLIVGSGGTVTIDPRKLMRSDGDIRGVMLFSTPKKDMDKIAQMIASAASEGAVKPVIRKVFSLSEADKAHTMVSSKGAAGKIILRI